MSRSASVALRALLAVAGVVFLLGALVRAVQDPDLSVLPSVPSLVIVVGGIVAALWGTAIAWARLLGRPLTRRLARGFMLAQFGKYVPGGIWQAVGLVEDASAVTGVGRVEAATAFVASVLTTIAAGLTVGAFVALDPSAPDAVRLATPVVAVMAVAMLAFPRWLTSIIRRIGPLRRRVGEGRIPGRTELLQAWAWSLPSLVATGLAYVIALGAPTDALLWRAGPAYALAWTIGFAALPFPAGLGVREAALLLLIPGIGSVELVASAAVLRLVYVVAEAVAAATTIGRRQEASAATSKTVVQGPRSRNCTLETPLMLRPVLVDKPWGGDRLRRLGRAVPAGARIGESWDLADLGREQTAVADPVSRVATGPLAGRSLADVIADDAARLMGSASATAAGRFPLLVKLLDARESLSVQVHPPASIAPDSYKTESWIVLDAEPGSALLLGVEDGVTLDDVMRAVGTADLLPMIRRVPVEVGDVVHLPAGTIHALGAGVLVAEVQTTSDTTYRVWDWPDERDGGRELHVDQAREAVAAGWEHNLTVSVARAVDGVIVDAEPYVLEHETLAPAGALRAADRTGAPRVVIVTAGEIAWGTAAPLPTGGVTLLPAACSMPVVAGPHGATVVVATPR